MKINIEYSYNSYGEPYWIISRGKDGWFSRKKYWSWLNVEMGWIINESQGWANYCDWNVLKFSSFKEAKEKVLEIKDL